MKVKFVSRLVSQRILEEISRVSERKSTKVETIFSFLFPPKVCSFHCYQLIKSWIMKTWEILQESVVKYFRVIWVSLFWPKMLPVKNSLFSKVLEGKISNFSYCLSTGSDSTLPSNFFCFHCDFFSYSTIAHRKPCSRSMNLMNAISMWSLDCSWWLYAHPALFSEHVKDEITWKRLQFPLKSVWSFARQVSIVRFARKLRFQWNLNLLWSTWASSTKYNWAALAIESRD